MVLLCYLEPMVNRTQYILNFVVLLSLLVSYMPLALVFARARELPPSAALPGPAFL